MQPLPFRPLLTKLNSAAAAAQARFPYSIPENGGWHIWGDCGGNLTVDPGSAAQARTDGGHSGDWNVLNSR